MNENSSLEKLFDCAMSGGQRKCRNAAFRSNEVMDNGENIEGKTDRKSK